MFSKVSHRLFQLHKSLFLKNHTICAINTSTVEKSILPADSSKRDLVNFPRRVRPERAPPTRWLFIPESWFQAFYPKTGVTGPYMFGITFGTFLISKEYLVTHAFPHAEAFCIFVAGITITLGDTITKWYNETFDEEEKIVDSYKENQMNALKTRIYDLENSYPPENLINEVMKAKEENILLQMESHFRERIEEVYYNVKKHLDYQVELENSEKKIMQKNLVDYIISNVYSSITPEIEKKTLQMCIQNLNQLAARA